MKKLLTILIFILTFQISSLADDMRDFQIEGMSIGDSALDYFSEAQLEDNEQNWWNYSYKEYSTSLLPGKGIYHWFQISYKSDDDNFIIEALTGGLEKINYDNKECNKKLDAAALDISELFENIKQGRKQLYKIVYDPREIYHAADELGKSIVTSISFNFLNEGEIILACYNMDKETNQKNSFKTSVRSLAFVYYLRETE